MVNTVGVVLSELGGTRSPAKCGEHWGHSWGIAAQLRAFRIRDCLWRNLLVQERQLGAVVADFWAPER